MGHGGFGKSIAGSLNIDEVTGHFGRVDRPPMTFPSGLRGTFEGFSSDSLKRTFSDIVGRTGFL
jgi:hypothetical protein